MTRSSNSGRHKGAVTIADVARRARTTPTAVSHALSGARPVSAELRSRITRAIDELGYKPSPAARSLATGRSYAIVLDTVTAYDVDHQSLWWHIQLSSEISRVLQEREYRLIFLASDTLDGQRLAQMARTRVADGFILPQIHLTDPRVQALRDIGAPFVTIGRPRKHGEIAWVDADTSAGAEMATYHLLDLGHRDILFIGWSGIGARYGNSYQAHLGIKAAFRRRGLPWPDTLTRYVRHDSSVAGHRAMEDALDRDLPFTAVMTSSDALGVGALYTLWERSYRVPTDVSVFSCSDSAATALAYLSLSTLQLPRAEMGQAAVETLLEQIEGGAPPVSHTLLPTSLSIRQSTGPAPHGGRPGRT